MVYDNNCEEAELLFKCFVLCHDVIPMQIHDKVVMSGTSQDELIHLELASKSFYFTLDKRDSECIHLLDN